MTPQQAANTIRWWVDVLDGEDLRLNGCVCKPDMRCYLHSHGMAELGAALKVLEVAASASDGSAQTKDGR